jgi:PAS domain-containing protein
VNLRDLLLALLLPLPPWLGFWIFRLKGRVGLSYGYFLGGILAVLAMPWPSFAGKSLPSAQLGGALLGFSLFLQAHREGRTGIRRMAVGLGGATAFAWILGASTGVPMGTLGLFWATGILVGLMWLGLSDLGYRLARGRYLEIRMPMVGAITFLIATLLHRVLPLGSPAFSWSSSLLSGALLGLVALQQLLWLRGQGLWVEGRGDGFRVALSALESDLPAPGPALAYRIEAQQPILLLDERGLIFEANEAFARLVGLQRHQIRGFELEALLQGGERGVWDNLRQQLLRDAFGAVAATLVRKDGGFQEVALEAAAFDRNMALVWVVAEAPGTLAIRTRGQSHVLLHGGLDRTRAVNALGSLMPATERLLASATDPEVAGWAEIARTASLRLSAVLGTAREMETPPALDAVAGIDALLPRLQRMFPPEVRIQAAVDPLALQIGAEPLERILTQLLLHARTGLKEGSLRIALDAVDLGGRRWGLLRVGAEGVRNQAPPSGFLGLSWTQEVVSQCRGLLELREQNGGGVQPRVYLHVEDAGESADPVPLAGRTVWIVDLDPLVREALTGLVLRAGGEARGFADLKAFLKASRSMPLPDLAVLERTGRLDRFHTSLRRISKEVLPTLVLGNGDLIPVHSLTTGVHLVGFLEKPFFAAEFVQSLLALCDSAKR